MSTVAIIQARMGSSRLPGKVLALISGEPMLQHVVRRVSRTTTVDKIVVATSNQIADDNIAFLCQEFDIDCFRGNEANVLDRYYQAAMYFQAQQIVRVTGDCPLIDPDIIDQVVTTFREGTYDYVGNINPPTYPDGLDVEIFSFEALEHSWKSARLLSEREHVTLYVRNHPELFCIGNVSHEKDLSAMRWVVDESRDLTFVRAVYRALGKGAFHMADVLQLLQDQPELLLLNSDIMRDEGLLKSLREDRELL